MKFTDSILLAAALFGSLINSCEAFSTSSSNAAGYRRFGSSAIVSRGSRLNMQKANTNEMDISRVMDCTAVPKSEKLSSMKILAVASIALSSCLFSFSGASLAVDRDTGTITDKKYELCVSKCVFSETRPPPNGADNERILTTISRTDIIKGCRKTCAKTKEQLYLGKPKIKVAAAQQTQQ